MKRSIFILAAIAPTLVSAACHKSRHESSDIAHASTQSPGDPTPTVPLPGWEPTVLSPAGELVKIGGPHYVLGDVLVKGKWYRNKQDLKAKMDDTWETRLILESDTTIALRHDSNGKRLRESESNVTRPQLWLGCDIWENGHRKPLDPQHEFNAFIDIGSPPGKRDVPVRLRFDKEPVSSESWSAIKDVDTFPPYNSDM